MAFAYKGTFTVTSNSSLLPGTQTDYPLLVKVTDNVLKSTGNGGQVTDAQGDDIVFYSDSGLSSILKFERELWDAATGEIIYWVKIPSLALGTVFYAGIGDSGVTTFQGDPTNVWDSGFKLVNHLGDGSTVSLTNSKTNGSARQVAPAAVAGKIHGGAEFGSGEYLASDGASGSETIGLAGSSDVTISWWGYKASGNVTSGSGLEDLFLTIPSSRFGGHFPFTDNVLYWDHCGPSNGRLSTAYDAYLDKWTHVVLTGKGDNSFGSLSLDGVEKVTRSIGEAFTDPVSGFIYFDNALWTVDEMRLSSMVRSANWNTIDYNSQADPATFVSSSFAAAGRKFILTTPSA